MHPPRAGAFLISAESEDTMKILIIEDEHAIRADMIEVLHYENFEVYDAANGSEGVKLAREHLPDLILCDIRMPGITGFDVFQALQWQSETAAIPFIFLTAFVDADLREQAEALGVVHYLTKPFRLEELLELVNSFRK
jgi:CheY-like chemotaxis protein